MINVILSSTFLGYMYLLRIVMLSCFVLEMNRKGGDAKSRSFRS